MKLTIFTSANESFFSFAEDMIDSLLKQLNRGLKRVDAVTICCFDDGLTSQQLKILRDKDVIIIHVDDVFSYYPEFQCANTSSPLSYLVRPLLPHFTYSDIIMWVDADIWFQDHIAIEDMIWGANFGDIVAVPDTGRLASYRNVNLQTCFLTDLFQYYGENAAERFSKFPLLNNGFFTAKVTSPIWKSWQIDFNYALKAVDGNLNFGVDQTSFNYTIYNNNLQFIPLPFTYNCSALTIIPSIVDGVLCLGTVPFEKISAFHLTGKLAKWELHNINILNKEGEFVRVVSTHLTYSHIKQLLTIL